MAPALIVGENTNNGINKFSITTYGAIVLAHAYYCWASGPVASEIHIYPMSRSWRFAPRPIVCNRPALKQVLLYQAIFRKSKGKDLIAFFS